MPEGQAAAPPAASGAAPLVDPIARYCRNSGHVRPGLCQAHFNAFMPKLQESSGQLEVSVFHASGQTPAALEHIGRTVVRQPLKGHVLVPLAAIVARNLRVVPAPEPHPLHANILGWSDNKGVQRLDAKALADASSQLTMYADPA
jgi:hypothetical protein